MPIAADGATSLTTARLVLRPFAPEDAAPLQREISEWDIVRNLQAVPYPYEREHAVAWIGSAEAERKAGRAIHLAVTLTDTGALIGGVGMRLDPAARRGHLGYWIGRRHWRKGYATEAARRLSHWALANLDLDRLVANVAVGNAGSAQVLRRIGFIETGEALEHFASRGGDVAVQCFEAARQHLFGPAVEPEPGAGSGMLKLVLVVACAMIDADGRVLLARRPEGKKMAGLWEFPGGKLDPGESPEAALIRELHEELGIDVSASCLAPFGFASHAYAGFHLLMPLFLCRRWNGTPTPREGQSLAWVRPNRLHTYAMPEADRPLVPMLRDFL